MATVYKTTFKLRRGTLAEWDAKNPILADGEPGFAIDQNILRIGNGATAWKDLKDINGAASQEGLLLTGYLLNGEFYTDSTYTVLLEKNSNCIYIDKNSNSGYTWTGEKYAAIVADATADVAGLVKLYQVHGDNEDGTMSQKVVTEGVNSIALTIDGTDKECLVLDLPWD